MQTIDDRCLCVRELVDCPDLYVPLFAVYSTVQGTPVLCKFVYVFAFLAARLLPCQFCNHFLFVAVPFALKTNIVILFEYIYIVCASKALFRHRRMFPSLHGHYYDNSFSHG